MQIFLTTCDFCFGKTGVTDLYVHVVANNQAAMMLYTKGGFLYEKEETVLHARMLSRPRRLLLHKRIQTPIST